MNATLGEFFAREGVAVAGLATKDLPPSEFQNISSSDHIALAYEHGRKAFQGDQSRNATACYIGGGTWIAEPVCAASRGRIPASR